MRRKIIIIIVIFIIFAIVLIHNYYPINSYIGRGLLNEKEKLEDSYMVEIDTFDSIFGVIEVQIEAESKLYSNLGEESEEVNFKEVYPQIKEGEEYYVHIAQRQFPWNLITEYLIIQFHKD